ncbi:hypothetical protein D3C71_1712270 [compost metagenome]
MLGHGAGIGAGCHGHGNAVCARRLQVHTVHAGAVLGHDAQLRRRGQHAGGDGRGAAQHDGLRVGLGQACGQRVFGGAAGQKMHLAAGLLNDALRGLGPV